VITTGFEPVTVCLEGRCSIQLSYVTLKKEVLTAIFSGGKSKRISALGSIYFDFFKDFF